MAINPQLIMRKASSLLDAGRIDECETYLKERLGEAESANQVYAMGIFLCALGEMLFEQGRIDDARAFLHRFIEIAPDDDVLQDERLRVEELLNNEK